MIDALYLLGIAVLWGVMALLVSSFKKLEKPAGVRT